MFFTRQWLKEHYIDKRMSARQIAEIVGCSADRVYDYVRLWGLRKKDDKLRWSGKTDFIPANKGKPCPDHVKAKKRANMPHRKPVVMLSKKTGMVLKRFDSTTIAAKETGISRNNIKAVLHGKRRTAGGYAWRYARTYGEELVYRLDNLDFSQPIDKVVKGLYRGLPPRLPYKKAIEHYSRKLRACWLGVAS